MDQSIEKLIKSLPSPDTGVQLLIDFLNEEISADSLIQHYTPLECTNPLGMVVTPFGVIYDYEIGQNNRFPAPVNGTTAALRTKINELISGSREYAGESFLLNAQNGDISSACFRLMRGHRRDGFEAILRHYSQKNKPINPQAYWETLSHLWIDTEQATEHSKWWGPLLEASIPQQEAFMSKEDRKHYEETPNVITIYRGVDVDLGPGYSWTEDKARAQWFAQRRHDLHNATVDVLEVSINPRDAIAYLDSRGEREWIVSPAHTRAAKSIHAEIKDLG